MTPCSAHLREDEYAIFLFHGVISQRRNPIRNYTGKHLARNHFVEILRDLHKHGAPVSMPEVVTAHKEGRRLPERAFAVTFDDGFENNYSIAAPILAEMKLPATFYITTGFVDSNSPSWIDMVEFAIERTHSVTLDLPYPGLRGHFESREEKIGLLDTVRRVVKNDAHLDPYEFAHNLWKQVGVAHMDPDPELDQKMSWRQVRELSQNELFTVGGHGHTHRILGFLPPDQLEREIAISIETMRSHLHKPAQHYSYPEGLENCYSEQVIKVLQGHGIVCSPSAMHGTNRFGDNLFNLRRIQVV